MENHSNSNKKELVFGLHAVKESLSSEQDVEKILIQKFHDHDKEQFKEILNLAKDLKVQVQYVPLEKLNTYTRKNHQGVVAFVSSIIYADLDNIVSNCFDQGKMPFILILDRITDVRNFGAIARTAECAGVNAIVVPTKGSAQITGDAIKTSSGALNHLPVCRVDSLVKTVEYLRNSGLRVIGCTEKAAENVFSIDLTGPLAIVMGSEEDGISSEVLKKCDELGRFPMFGQISSMNVSVAAGIIMYDAVRQRIG